MMDFKQVTKTSSQSEGTKALCPHGFTYCYCSYIQVQGLLSHFYAKALSVDEVVGCSYFYLLVLYWNIEVSELQGILHRLKQPDPLTRETYDDILKRLHRCNALNDILVESGALVRSVLNRKTYISFRLSSADPQQLFLYQDIHDLTIQTNEMLLHLRDTEKDMSLDILLLEIEEAIQNHKDISEQIQERYKDTMKRLASIQDVQDVAFTDVVPAEALLSSSKLILAKYHPGAIEDPYRSSDQMTFVIAHEAFEVYFPSFITALNRVIAILKGKKPDIVAASYLLRLCSAMFKMFWLMIEVPETMTAQDYITFRGEIRGGSGAESIQFRAVEILMGLRDPKYKENMKLMHLFTPQLQALWSEPSINSAMMDQFVSRGVISLKDDPDERAKKIAQKILKPIGHTNVYADLLELSEAAIDLEQKRELWQQHHIAMVERMIGGKPSIGVGGIPMKGKVPKDMKIPHSMPYLQQTLHYARIFGDLWRARDYMHENWAVPPVTWEKTP